MAWSLAKRCGTCTRTTIRALWTRLKVCMLFNPGQCRLLTILLAYLLAIDMTARNVQDEAKKKGLPWSIAKGFDSFLPLAGPVPKSAIPDPHKAHLSLTVNDQVKQSDNTDLMLFRIPRILSDISKVMKLEKGDIVLTGTPKGVGPVTTGDIMKAALKYGDKELARLEVDVKDREGLYEFKET